MDGDNAPLVVVGDRRHLLGDCLVSLLNQNGYVALAAPQAEIAIKEAARIGAALAVVDIDNPIDTALATLHEARNSGYSVPVLAVADDPEYSDRRKALRAGAQAVLSRSHPTGAFLRCVGSLCRGQVVLPALDPPAGRSPGAFPRTAELTSREIQILQGLARGSSTSELSQQFGLQNATVRTYVQRVLMKLGVHNRAAAVATAVQAGLLRPGAKGSSAAPGSSARLVRVDR